MKKLSISKIQLSISISTINSVLKERKVKDMICYEKPGKIVINIYITVKSKVSFNKYTKQKWHKLLAM